MGNQGEAQEANSWKMLRRQLAHHLVFNSSALTASILASDGAFLDGGKEERECESGIEPANRGPRTTIGGALVNSPVLETASIG
jgi:hypothetical protein